MNPKIDKNTLSSAHINFLFGAGVNGDAFPQLSSFEKTIEAINARGGNTENGIEAGIDSLTKEEDRSAIKDVFADEFEVAHEKFEGMFRDGSSTSLINLEDLLKKMYTLVQATQNRNASMKQINIYSLNYDEIVEKILCKVGYLYNSISASNTSTKSAFLDIIGYNYNTKKYVPYFMISKLHGDIKKPIIPGKSKYQEVLNEDYFEIVFNMKEKLCRHNSILMVIGYSGKDNHINKILKECINVGLTVYWYKYSEADYVPPDFASQVIIREQDDYANPKDSTLNCLEDLNQAWETRLEE